MRQTSGVARSIVALVVVAWGGAMAPVACSQTISLSLNVFRSDPLAESSGGVWQVAAKSTGSFGISHLDLKLTGIDPPSSQPVGPRGVVNQVQNDPAGFTISDPFLVQGNTASILVAQQAIARTLGIDEEQSIFYGVGTVANGQPGDVGPTFTTLSNKEAIPWATGDPFGDGDWGTAAILASGVFASGLTPAFVDTAESHTTGSVFITAGTSAMVGTSMFLDSVTTIVRVGGSPDYNRNGVVDAADYTVWRDTLGQMAPGLPADGNLNGTVDQPDYDFWKANFGLVIPGPGAGSLASRVVLGPGPFEPGSSVAVPEPAVGTLLLGAGGILFLRQRLRLFRTARRPLNFQ